jgi:hypothetical protein
VAAPCVSPAECTAQSDEAGKEGEHLDERQLERRLSELALLWGDSKTGEAGPMGLLWP